MNRVSRKLSCSINNILYPVHGGNRHSAVRELDMPDERVIDFSASVNPLEPSPSVRLVLGSMDSYLAEYPDPETIPLREKVSEYLNVHMDQILVTNGSTELIHLLPRVLGRRKEVLILNPCFSEYEEVFRLNRIHTYSLNYDVEENFQMNPETVVSRLRRQPEIEMLILGHPNNPTGHVWSESSLDMLVEYCKSQKIILVVDETFIEFCQETVSALKWMQNNQHLIVIRSMTKFFGLAGIRLGYGVMHPSLRIRLKKYQVPWSVNTIAQKMGIAVLEDRNHAQQTRRVVRDQRGFLFSELNGLQGIRVFPSRANFLLFQLTSDRTETVHQFYLSLMKDGILIRNCGNFSGLDKSYFRIAVRMEKENEVLVSRIKSQLGEKD